MEPVSHFVAVNVENGGEQKFVSRTKENGKFIVILYTSITSPATLIIFTHGPSGIIFRNTERLFELIVFISCIIKGNARRGVRGIFSAPDLATLAFFARREWNGYVAL